MHVIDNKLFYVMLRSATSKFLPCPGSFCIVGGLLSARRNPKPTALAA